MKKILFFALMACLICSCKKDVTETVKKASAYMEVTHELAVDECNYVSHIWHKTIQDDVVNVRKDGYGIYDLVSHFNDTNCVRCYNFNEALGVYYKSERRAKSMEQIALAMDSCKTQIQLLKDHKSSQDKLCEQVKLTYRALQDVVDCAENPKGSLVNYVQDVNTKSDAFQSSNREILNMLEFE